MASVRLHACPRAARPARFAEILRETAVVLSLSLARSFQHGLQSRNPSTVTRLPCALCQEHLLAPDGCPSFLSAVFRNSNHGCVRLDRAATAVLFHIGNEDA